MDNSYIRKRFQDLKDLIIDGASKRRGLGDGAHGIYIDIINPGNFQEVSNLYNEALERGDWMATEYSHIEGFIPNRSFFEEQSYIGNQIWFVFLNSMDIVVGSTKLLLCDNGSILIDETQLHPKLGQGRNIMHNYFTRIIPLLNDSEFRYWTEFILSVGSRSLRKILLADLNMCVTGIRPACYINCAKAMPVSCITAHAPASAVYDICHDFLRLDIPLTVRNLLDVILGNNIERSPHKLRHADEVQPDVSSSIFDAKQLQEMIDAGYDPVAIDPFKELVLFAFPDRALSAQLWYLEKEPSPDVKRVVRYVINNNMPLNNLVS